MPSQSTLAAPLASAPVGSPGEPASAPVPRSGPDSGWPRPLAVGLAIFIGIADLLYWWSSTTRGALGPVLPMSPAAAVAFLTLGLVFAAWLVFPAVRTWPAAVLAPAGLAVLAVGAAVISHLVPGVPDWESVLDPAALKFFDLPAGHTHNLTFLLVAATAFNLCAILLPPSDSRWWRVGAAGASACAVLGFLTLVADTGGNPMFSGAGLLGVTPLAALEFLLLNAALAFSRDVARQFHLWFLGPEAADTTPHSLRDDRLARWFFGLLACVAIAGVTYLRIQTSALRNTVAEDLKASVLLKASQITKWRQEREGDATTIWSAPWYRETTTAMASTGLRPEQRAEVESVIANFLRVYGYQRQTIFDLQMRPIFSLPDEADLTPAPLQQALATRFTGRFLETPVYVDRSGKLLWGHIVQIRRRFTEEPGAYILMQIDLGAALFPALRAWPRGNVTGQALLWVRKGNELFALGGYRDTPQIPAARRVPFADVRNLDQSGLTISRIAAGDTEAFEGRDVRGIPMLGAGRLISNSDWLVTATMRAEEVYAPLRRTSWMVVGFSSAILGLVGFVTTRFWREQQQEIIHDRLLADLNQKRTAARLGLVMRHAKDIIFVTDENMRFVEVNHQAEHTYGWTREELLGMTFPELRAPEARDNPPVGREESGPTDGKVFETIHRRKDGTTFPVEISTRSVDIEGQRQRLSIIRDISERKRAEMQLRDSEDKFSKAFQANPSGIALTDLASGRYIEVNDSFCRIMGYSRDELIGRTSVELGIWADADARRRMFEPLLEGGRFHNFKMQVRPRDGGEKTVLVTAELIELRGQRGVLSLIEDITDRLRAEAALRESEERYRLIAENTSDVIWLYEPAAQTFSYVSPAITTLLGYSPEEMIGRRLTDALAPESAARMAELIESRRKARGAGETVPRHLFLEVDQIRKDGSRVPTEVVVTSLEDAQGKVSHVLGITRDITERKRARETLEKFNTELEQRVEQRTNELAARNREVQALLDAMPDTVLLCNDAGQVMFARSNKYPGVTGLVTGERTAQSRPALDAVILEIVRGMCPVVLREKETLTQEYERPIEEGRMIWLEARAALIGQARVLVLIREITSRKRVEQGVLANLEREKQLSEMKSQFISVASHEFRTPLAAAVGSLELLERHAAKITEAKRVELVGRIQRSLGRLTAIMNDVLSLSRAESGRVKVSRMNADLVKLAQDIVREIELGDAQKHRFAFAVTGGPENVPVDPKLTNHILSNLVSNAVRYSPAGTTITVNLHIDAAAFTFTVADEGIGVPEAERDRIFEPFARGSNVGQISGTGLGLNIVKRYTELMGGTIELLPSDRGAVFRVIVPLAQPPAS